MLEGRIGQGTCDILSPVNVSHGSERSDLQKIPNSCNWPDLSTVEPGPSAVGTCPEAVRCSGAGKKEARGGRSWIEGVSDRRETRSLWQDERGPRNFGRVGVEGLRVRRSKWALHLWKWCFWTLNFPFCLFLPSTLLLCPVLSHCAALNQVSAPLCLWSLLSLQTGPLRPEGIQQALTSPFTSTWTGTFRVAGLVNSTGSALNSEPRTQPAKPPVTSLFSLPY